MKAVMKTSEWIRVKLSHSQAALSVYQLIIIIQFLCGNKMPTRCNRWYLLQILLLTQHVSGHHYAHHQELESIIQMVAACGIWSFGFQVVGMVWSWGLCVRFAGCYTCMPSLGEQWRLYRCKYVSSFRRSMTVHWALAETCSRHTVSVCVCV